ncbi:30S ribosomal protein S7 [Tichowtungia aerotolerans]|uniref:Small ribosomal subunit protein uS7 n=1 Tax=Tichowtungia aerotolerans TaxID=2697043 RepID=A0A6P1M7W0_9BACT|nr:30S ribosomal protein S7 [Tichowtungia aerotolerans]QHI68258.1 30S ribosomal protein S7 [Tichowtungia aerotolerans]
MARRRAAEKRTLTPDPRYNSELIAYMINAIMGRGKKATAASIVYGALEDIQSKLKDEDPLAVLTQAMENIKPKLEVKSRRVGGATYQVPVEVGPKRQTALASRWLIQYSKGRRGMPMRRALSMELLDAYANQGSCIKKRDDTHKMAQANKAFAHYRW